MSTSSGELMGSLLSLKINVKSFSGETRNFSDSFTIETRSFLHSNFLKDDKAFV